MFLYEDRRISERIFQELDLSLSAANKNPWGALAWRILERKT